MNCELVLHLIDEYVAGDLSRYDARRVERHLDSCSTCARELRKRPQLDRRIRRALSASVQHRSLSPEASLRIVREAQDGLQRAVWSNRAAAGLRFAAVAAALALVLAGILFLTGDTPVSSSLGPIVLSPIRRLVPLEQASRASIPTDRPALPKQELLALSEGDQAALWLTDHRFHIDPTRVKAGEPFTLTMFLSTDMPRTLDAVRVNLEINGPSGFYRFELTVQGPFPTQGVSVVRITPEDLAPISQERYLISPSEIFGTPGTYSVHVQLISPDVTPAR